MGVAEAAGTEIIHYGPTEILPGVVINMQTMYMSWLTMLIVAAIVFAATRHVERIPHGIQNLVEMFIEWLDKLMDANLGIEGRRMATPFVITLFLFIFVANEIGLMPSIAFHFYPEDGVQGGSTLWKLTQAITAHARELTPERSRELHEISGSLLNRVKLQA